MERRKRTSKKRLQQLESWILNDAVELWSSKGLAAGTGAGFDRLDFAGRPCGDIRLVANQARLAYVFARAEMFPGARGHQRLYREIFDFVSRQAVSADRSDGYLHSFDTHWQPLDARFYLADHSLFCVASLAAYAAYGGGADMRRAANIQRWLERRFAQSDSIYQDRLEPSSDYSLASQVALIDSLLAFFEISRRPVWLDKALTALEAVVQRFAEPSPRGLRLRQFCDTSPLTDNDYCRLEDQLEFIWLLCRARRGEPDRASWSIADYWQWPAVIYAESDLAGLPTCSLCRIVKVSLALQEHGVNIRTQLLADALDELLNRCKRAPVAGYIEAGGGIDGMGAEELFELMRICVSVKWF